jgi:hypothetical protein
VEFFCNVHALQLLIIHRDKVRSLNIVLAENFYVLTEIEGGHPFQDVRCAPILDRHLPVVCCGVHVGAAVALLVTG